NFLRVVGELDAAALKELSKGANLSRLARSPNLLGLIRTDAPGAIRILGGPFRYSIENCESYLAQVERLPATSRQSLFEALLARDALPPDVLLRAARGLGELNAATRVWLRS